MYLTFYDRILKSYSKTHNFWSNEIFIYIYRQMKLLK